MTFRDLFESNKKMVIQTNKKATGSSFCMKIKPDEQEKILNALASLNNPKIEDWYYSLDEKYSDELIIRFNNIQFSLYARNEELRIGAGGPLSSCKVVKEYLNISDFISYIPKAKIR